jgi:class 3 adenylate cyclase
VSAQAGGRRLAAILAADVVGYSRLVGADEPGTLAKLAALRSSVIDPQMAAYGGRVFKTTGDGLLAEFPSAVQALRCAIAIQEEVRGAEDVLQLRIGLHAADVVVQDGDLFGDGVNVAARLEPLAEPGGICISGRVREDAAGKVTLDVEDLGEPELKNITQRHRVFRVRFDAPQRPALPLPEKPSIAVLPFQNMSGDPEQEYFADGMVEEIITGSRVCDHSSLSLAIRALPTRANRRMCGRSGANLACATFWKAACERRAIACGLRDSWSMRQMGSTSGPTGSMARWKTYSKCRIGSRAT